MALHLLHPPRLVRVEPASDRVDRLEADLADARALLLRLVAAEDRIGLVHPITDDARRWLARSSRR